MGKSYQFFSSFVLGLTNILLVGCGAAGSGGGSGGEGSAVSSSNGTAASSMIQSQLAATWAGTVAGYNDVMQISSSGNVTSSYCGSVSTITKNVESACPAGFDSCGTVAFTTTQATGKAGCLANGNHSCVYGVSSGSLSFTCGGSILTYAKVSNAAAQNSSNSNGCVSVSSGAAMTFAGGTAYGQQAVSLSSTGIVGSGAIGSYSLGNYQYQRTTAQGDTIYLTVGGSATQSNSGFVAQVSLSAQSIQQVLNSFGPTAAVCGVWFGQYNNAPLVLLTPGSAGSLGSMIPTPGMKSMGVYISYQGGSHKYGSFGDDYYVLP